MRPKRIVKNFQSRVDYACGKDDLRPAMQNVYFENGFLYATNAHIAIKQSLKLHQFNDEEIEILDGKMIHRKQFAEIYKHDVISVQEDGILCQTDGVKIKHLWKEETNKFPNVDKVIQDALNIDCEPTNSIFVSVSLASIFKNIFVFGGYGHGCEFHFKRKNKAILLTPVFGENKELDQIGLLMPVASESKFI